MKVSLFFDEFRVPLKILEIVGVVLDGDVLGVGWEQFDRRKVINVRDWYNLDIAFRNRDPIRFVQVELSQPLVSWRELLTKFTLLISRQQTRGIHIRCIVFHENILIGVHYDFHIVSDAQLNDRPMLDLHLLRCSFGRHYNFR